MAFPALLFIIALASTVGSRLDNITFGIFGKGVVTLVLTLIVAAFILAEAGLSFLGLGIELPTASWGNLLSQASEYYTLQPWLLVWPGLAVLLTTLAFNLLGDGLRDAFDPRSSV
jgi:peptide/nickel transport system permease protein